MLPISTPTPWFVSSCVLDRCLSCIRTPEDSVKVARMFGTGRAASIAAVALVVSIAIQAGTALVPCPASALPVNPAGGRTGTLVTAPEPPADAASMSAEAPAPVAETKSAALRKGPSGLQVVDARTADRRMPTPASKAARVAAYRAYRAEVAATALTGSGPWKSAKVSWYGPGFYGNTMAGGGTLRPTSMVVAHRTLPFGTKIEFSYKGKTCVAVVRDRGPYVSGRVFDLGPGTANALGFSGVGTVGYRIVK